MSVKYRVQCQCHLDGSWQNVGKYGARTSLAAVIKSAERLNREDGKWRAVATVPAGRRVL